MSGLDIGILNDRKLQTEFVYLGRFSEVYSGGNMSTTTEKKAKLEKYGRSQEETLRCSEYARWWPKETSHRMRIADEVRNQLFYLIFPGIWGDGQSR